MASNRRCALADRAPKSMRPGRMTLVSRNAPFRTTGRATTASGCALPRGGPRRRPRATFRALRWAAPRADGRPGAGADPAHRGRAGSRHRLPGRCPARFRAGGPPAGAEKLMQAQPTRAERAQAGGTWRVSLAPLSERRPGPRKVTLDPGLAPASRWNPAIPGVTIGPSRDRFVRSAGAPRALPSRDDDIAFASVRDLSRWIQSRALTSERLTRLYLERLERFQPRINAVITLTRDLALAQSPKADTEIAAGRYLGPLHGIPWGAKDLLDTAGIPTTYGAEPFRDRVPRNDAAVVERLHRAGAVLVAKLSLGALALNDIWFGGETKNPWLLEEGASGSSAGPGGATAGGCGAFAMASETVSA